MSVLVVHRNPFEPFPYGSWLADYPGEVIVLAARDRILAAGEAIPADHPGVTRLELLPDFSDEEELFRIALALAEKFEVSAVVAHHEGDVLVAARVREHLGLAGAWPADVLPYRDKALMKRMLVAAGIEVAEHAVVRAPEEVWEFADEHGYPVVVKDVAGYNAIGLRILPERADLVPFPEPVLVEAFVPGRMCHVDGLVVGGRIVLAWASQYQYELSSFGTDPGARIDLTLDVDDPLSARLLALAERTIAALRLTNGRLTEHAFHAEVFHTPDDRLVVCEIGSRPGGAKIREVAAAIFGVNLGEYVTRAQVGLDLPLLADTLAGGPPPRPARMSGQVLMMKRPGAVRSVPEPPTEPWVSRFWRYAEPGGVIPPAAGSADFLLAAVATGADRAEAESRLRALGARFEAETVIEAVGEFGEGARS
ncbi:hypothetical protein V5P93_005119 [Actinokineospora auranticolor]|uniref:Biotin carboxylase n=1 Tax=Actinokineospora auranticolor TaxID=155976 RepID=A0A2S6GKD8_9PSEU|nr:hypothetical protein [Actinokineospora auranticolor]PPK65650.1 biotin carboxylase [Actinokineospora auranticolor]